MILVLQETIQPYQPGYPNSSLFILFAPAAPIEIVSGLAAKSVKSWHKGPAIDIAKFQRKLVTYTSELRRPMVPIPSESVCLTGQTQRWFLTNGDTPKSSKINHYSNEPTTSGGEEEAVNLNGSPRDIGRHEAFPNQVAACQRWAEPQRCRVNGGRNGALRDA